MKHFKYCMLCIFDDYVYVIHVNTNSFQQLCMKMFINMHDV